jgi:histidyl-tRNA synthetase
MGDVVLGELLRDRGLMPAAAPGSTTGSPPTTRRCLPMVMRVTTLLRRVGHSVEYALRDQALGKQLKAAQAAGARDRRRVPAGRRGAAGQVTLRRLSDGVRRCCPCSRGSSSSPAAR